MKKITSSHIIFITGAFVSNTCWDSWIRYFEQKGYTCMAPAWPNKEGSAKDLRAKHPSKEIASNRLTDLVEHYAKIVSSLPEKPIVIGHSLGGLVAQLLLQRNLVAAAVAIHSAPPQGVMTLKPSFVRSIWEPLGFFTSAQQTFLMSFAQWQYVFTNGLPYEEQRSSYESYLIPESKLVLRDGLTPAAKINFKKSHEPLLFIAGSQDNIMPASLNRTNYLKYKNGNPKSVTDFKEFPGRTHYILGQSEWKENAAYILDWLNGTSAS